MFENLKKQKTLGKYRVIKTLGTGLFKVKLVYDPSTGNRYAAKVCKYSLRKGALEKEASLLQELSKENIPHVVKYIECIDNTDSAPKWDCHSNSLPSTEYNFKYALILELASKETLFDIVYHNGKLEEKLARTYFKQLSEAVGSLHAHGYVHRDLKPENILLSEKFQLKVADFGFGRDFDDDSRDKMTTRLGTENYMAPEMYTAYHYSGIKIDSFSCGVLLFLFIVGRPPFFKASSNDPFYKHIIRGEPEKFWALYEEKLNEGQPYNKDLKNLITDLLKSNPDDRLDIGDADEYEWLKGDIYSDEELLDVMRPLREVVEKASLKPKM